MSKLRRRQRPELESYDEYARVVVNLDGKTRVIECRDGVQWIVQRAVLRNGHREWLGAAFCRTKEALLRCAGRYAGANPVLDALPDWFPEGARTALAEMESETEPTA